jgi:hypothetical protein
LVKIALTEIYSIESAQSAIKHVHAIKPPHSHERGTFASKDDDSSVDSEVDDQFTKHPHSSPNIRFPKNMSKDQINQVIETRNMQNPKLQIKGKRWSHPIGMGRAVGGTNCDKLS